MDRTVELQVGSVHTLDELAARRALRAQIARLERDLGEAFISAFPRVTLDVSVPASGGPRMLSIGELEHLRDALVERLTEARAKLDERGLIEEKNRELLERMLLEPGRYRYVRIKNSDLGEQGCGEWHVKPRLGLIGMLAGWWHVKLSSGCPLAGGPRVKRGPARDSRPDPWASARVNAAAVRPRLIQLRGYGRLT